MGGLGTATHLGIEQFKAATKIDLVIVPYKSGGLATADVLAGQVTMLFGGTSSASHYVATGKLRAIAITGERRNSSLPNVPTFIESGMKEVDSVSTFGSVAPAATPKEAINVLNGAMRKALQMPDVRQLLHRRADTTSSAARPRNTAPTSAAKWHQMGKGRQGSKDPPRQLNPQRNGEHMEAIPNYTKRQLAAGKVALGMGLRQARTVDIAAIGKKCGFEWLFIDMEHSSMDVDTAAQICAAALPVGITPIVRVPVRNTITPRACSTPARKVSSCLMWTPSKKHATRCRIANSRRSVIVR